ncbi:DUF6804 family protein [Sphingobacterium hungaricum]|uniref:Uncharacterized protein n=1 Tax=Sphingobacterium hungaricum TaxID=2082723 RepID=A0A928YQU6_9SPHI|nr:hypothetical protein [Sphingobacterium hungaricum]
MNLKNIQIGLIIVLMLCLLPMPYGYYTIVRICTVVYFGYLTFNVDTKSNKNRKVLFFYIAIIILFQPFIKLPVGRLIWNIIDVVVAIWILLHLGKKR